MVFSGGFYPTILRSYHQGQRGNPEKYWYERNGDAVIINQILLPLFDLLESWVLVDDPKLPCNHPLGFGSSLQLPCLVIHIL